MMRVIVGPGRIETNGAFNQFAGLGNVVRRERNHTQHKVGISVVRIEIEHGQTRGVRAAEIRAVQAGLRFAALVFYGLGGTFDLTSRLLSKRIAEFYTERAWAQHVAEISA
jgi:hypothetical protein